MVIYLPLAFIKDWLLKCLRHQSSKSSYEEEIVDESSSRDLDSAVQGNFENEHIGSLPNKECAIDIRVREEGNQLVLECEEIGNTLKQDQKRTAKEVAAVGFCLASIWFATEVSPNLHIHSVSLLYELNTEVVTYNVYFMQYLTNAALSQTSVASTTLLTSTSGLFTLLISVLMGEEEINVVKVVSVVVSIAGVAMTTIGKTWIADESQSSSSISKYVSAWNYWLALLVALGLNGL